MTQPVFFDNCSQADTFMQELFIGFNWDSNDFELILKEARYDDLHDCFSIIISLDNGNDWIDIFTYESNYFNEIPSNPIKLEGQGICKGVCCYAVVNWNAINDPSLADIDGVVQFNATIINEAATNLDNSPTIKHFIYEHALDNLSGEAVAHNKFLRECVNLPNVSIVPIQVSSFGELKNAINENNVVINLTSDIAIEKDNNSLYFQTEYNNQVINTLIYLNHKNLVINGNGHKVYEKGKILPTTYNPNDYRYEAPFMDDVTGNEAFIKSDGSIIPLARSGVYHSSGWTINGSRYGLYLPPELQNLYQTDTDNVFVCFRLNYQRLIRKIANAAAGVVYFDNNIDSFTLSHLNAHTPQTDFFLINYMEDGDGALIKNYKVYLPQSYGSNINQCWASHLFRVKSNSNIVFHNVHFIGGMGYAIRNDGKLRVNKCHFTNSIGGAICNYLQLSVENSCFSDIKTHAVRFDHIDANYGEGNIPYMDVTRCVFQDIGHYGSSSFAVWSTGKAYIAYNEFIDTNYGAIRLGLNNCTSVSSLHSENLVEWNYIHYSPEWKQERQLLGLQNSGVITIETNNQKAIVRFNRIVDSGGLGKNIGIYGNNGAYNMEIYGNVISGSENFYDIDCWDASPSFTGQTPNGSSNDVNTNNMIAYNIFDGYIRIQENSMIASSNCNFIKNFKLESNPNNNIQPSDVHENKFNQLDDYRSGEGIMNDESGIIAAVFLSVLGIYEPVNS